MNFALFEVPRKRAVFHSILGVWSPIAVAICVFALPAGTTHAGIPDCRIKGPDAVCLDSSMELCGPRDSDIDYRWTLPDGSTDDSRCIDVKHFSPADTGFYVLELLDEDTGEVADVCKHHVALTGPPCKIDAPPGVCVGSPVTLCGPEGDYGYRWRLPDGSDRDRQCIEIAAATASDAGTYVLELTDEDTKCTSICTHHLVVGTPPGCAIEADPMVCEGSATRLCAPKGDFEYEWKLPDGAIHRERCVSIPVAQAGDAGLYRLVLTNPITGCVSRECTHSLVVNPPPTSTITGPEAICTGDRSGLCGPTGDFEYEWRLPDGSTRTERCVSIPVAQTGHAGLYRLRVTDRVTWCKGQEGTHSLVVNPLPPHTISGPARVCSGDSTGLCGPQGDFDYQWTLPDESIRTERCVSIPAARSGDTGLYSLVVTDRATGCESGQGAHPLIVNPLPTCAISGPSGVCEGDTTQLCGPLGPYEYRWTLPDGSIVTDRCVEIRGASRVHSGAYSLMVTDMVGELLERGAAGSPFSPGLGARRAGAQPTACSRECSRRLSVSSLTLTLAVTPEVIVPPPPPSCETVGDLSSITFAYSGGDCGASSHDQGSKASCTDGSVLAQPMRIVYTGKDPNKFSVSPATESVREGDLVTLRATGREHLYSEVKLQLWQGSRLLQDLKIHTSCSQPLRLGDVFGALTVVGLNDRFEPRHEVTYEYVVRNDGEDPMVVTLSDGELDWTSDAVSLQGGASRTVTRTAQITQTTTSTVVASGRLLPDGPACESEASVTVTVMPPFESCADGRPKVLLFEYTGEPCTASRHSQDPSKSVCRDLGALSDPVQIVYVGSEPQDFSVTPADESIRTGDLVTFSAIARDELRSDSRFQIRRGGVTLQEVQIHTSCSQPLVFGDQFGSLELMEFHTRAGASAGPAVAASSRSGERTPAETGPTLLFDLHAGIPNPSTGSMTIRFTLARGGPARLTVHDVQGRLVTVLADGWWPAGTHAVEWKSGTSLATGIYFTRLESAEGIRSRKAVLIRP